MKKQRLKRAHSIPIKSIVYIVILVSLLLIATSYVYTATIVSQEKSHFLTLRENMLALESNLDIVKDGWEYEEYCTGYGSDITRNNKKVCYVRLESDGTSTDEVVTFKGYSKVIESSNHFEQTGLTSRIDNGDSFTQSSRYLTTDGRISCELRAVTTNREEISGNSIFMCFQETKDFYFERKDG